MSAGMASDELASFKSRVAALLRRISKEGVSIQTSAGSKDMSVAICPSCGDWDDHAPSCDLDALLKECEA